MATIFRVLLAASAMGAAGSAGAQDGDDWDYGHSAEQNASVAAVTFDTMGVAVRCMNDTLSVLLSGMPAGSGERSLKVAVGEQGEEDSLWVSARDSGTLFAVWPRALAHDLALGGRLSVAVPDGERVVRYAVELPASEAAIGRVLEACGQTLYGPVNDAPEGVNMAGLEWASPPEINFPGQSRYEGGIAAIVCTTRANGELEDCAIESEFPTGSGFGRASTLGAHRSGRVRPVAGGDSVREGRRIAFLTRFSLSNTPSLNIPSRLRDRD